MESRRKIIDDKVDLRFLVELFVEKKSQLDPLKKETDQLSDAVKAEMQSKQLEEFEVNGYKVKMTTTPKEDFNEEQAIEILRNTLTPQQFKDCVKSRPYIDDEAFERLVFAKSIDASILNPCRTAKDPTVTLRLSKVKK